MGTSVRNKVQKMKLFNLCYPESVTQDQNIKTRYYKTCIPAATQQTEHNHKPDTQYLTNKQKTMINIENNVQYVNSRLI